MVFGGWLGWIVHRAHVQRDAVAVIQRAGGIAFYDSEFKDGMFVPVSQHARPWAPIWLVDLIGRDYFGHVVYVNLHNRGSDAVLIHVGNLSRLEVLSLYRTPVTDTGLAQIGRLTCLKELALGWTKITDAGLMHLRSVKNLKELWLQDTQVTDAGFVHLRNLTSLWRLNVEGTQVTNRGVDDLRKALPSLIVEGIRARATHRWRLK
jgi:hypothetical protein